MKKINLSICLLFFFAVLFFALNLNAKAHVPLDTSGSASRTNPIHVEDHKISWAAYRELEKGNQVDYYRFEAQAGEKIYASMVIPVIDRLENFSPEFALIGPGLEEDYADLEQSNVDEILSLKEGEGVVVVVDNETGESDIFFEPFTQTSYWRRQEKTITAPETGTYYLAVFSTSGQTGKYTFSIGRKEKWGLSDLVKMPKIWWDTRMFVEKETSTYVITGLVGLGSIYLISRLFK
ncbi:MAG: hypothetical protein ACQEQG_00610 [Bacillota bacterium]